MPNANSLFTPLVESLPSTVPFVGPETIERRRHRIFRARIGANESAFGISPNARDAMANTIGKISRYSDPEGYDLKTAIANRHKISLEEVCLGAGIDELLGLVTRITVKTGTPVVTSLGAYPTFNYHVHGHGGTLHTVPYHDDHIDLDAIAKAAHATKARLVYLANPDNPMGTWHSSEKVENFIGALPKNCLLILDEAYIEFAPKNAMVTMDPAESKVVHMRTFSKAHGMAGARVGYAVAAKNIIQSINKVRNHFGMNLVSVAGALASFNDKNFINSVICSVEEGRQDYYRLASKMGFSSLPSATNFVAIDLQNGDTARAMLTALEDRDVFVRMPAVAPLDRCIRVTVGTTEERQLFSSAFADAFDSLHN